MAAKIAPTCVKCFDSSAIVSMVLDGPETADEVTFHCGGCEEDFTCEDVKNMLAALNAGWAKMLSWVDAMPEA